MFPRNAASPERIAIGPVVQISDGAVQTSGVAVKVIPFGSTEASGTGTVAYSADGVVLYTPVQAETNYTSFVLVASKSGCIPASVTVVTTAESTAGTVKTGSIATNAVNAAALASDAVTEIQSGLASQTSVDTLASYVDTEVAAIKAKTDNLPSDPADASDIAALFVAVNTKLDTIDDFLDTEIAAIKAKTDNLPTDPADQSAVEAAITAATSSLATSANQTTILDRQAYTLAVLAGACSDPQTASETYVLTIGGSTYTVDMAGQTSTGTRTAPTLTKT